jgi:hypothetical protein
MSENFSLAKVFQTFQNALVNKLRPTGLCPVTLQAFKKA